MLQPKGNKEFVTSKVEQFKQRFPKLPFLPQVIALLASCLTEALSKKDIELQKAQTEKFVDGMIAATQWLIDNGHLKAGKELNEMMLKALVSHSELDQDKV